MLHAQAQILLAGMDDGLNVLVADQIPYGCQVELQVGIDQSHAIAEGELNEANFGLVPILHDELGVEGNFALRSSACTNVRQSGICLDQKEFGWLGFSGHEAILAGL